MWPSSRRTTRWAISVALLVAVGWRGAAFGACSCPSDFELHSLSSTTIQIPLAWQPVAGATQYVLERSTSCDFSGAVAYSLSNAITAYGDTGRPPDYKYRFWTLPWLLPGLTSGVTYTYRMRAQVADQSELISNCVEGQLATEPVRGVTGDLWADVVLGQPDFAQNDFGKTTDASTQLAGGVVIDRTHTPNRMYLADTNHNRVLGFDHVGRCIGLGRGAVVGKPYTKSIEPNSEYPDTGNREFTDGHDTGATWIDPGSFGYPHGSGPLTVDVDIDLGSVKTLNTASLNSGGTNDHYTAASFELFVSDNGLQWTSAGDFDNPDRRFTLIVQFPPVSARYVRFRVHALTGCQDCDWLFLGEGKVGYTTSTGRICSVDAECDGDGTCLPDPDLRPQLLIGQPSFIDHGACNGDGTGQIFPARAPASASTLCLMNPFHLTPAETIYAGMMVMDTEGSLYVSDLFNNRILKYVVPFGTDPIADDVWGQADFSGNECNRGAGEWNPGANTLCLEDRRHGGITLDSAGSLWVADITNSRVLRFPKVGGSIAHEADIVLGQPSFTSSGSGTRLDQMIYPLDVAFDTVNGRLYVADAWQAPGSRIMEFRPPFVSGMSAARKLPVPMYCDFDYPAMGPSALRMDNLIHGLWVQNTCFYDELFDLDTSPPRLRARVRVPASESDGIDVNSQGDLFAMGKWSGLHEFKRADIGTDAQINESQARRVFSEEITVSSDSMRGGYGVTVLGNQLIASDNGRLLIWNNPDTLQSGQPADDLYGQPDFQTIVLPSYGYAYPQAYGGQLWVNRMHPGVGQDVAVFDPPLTNASTPVATIPIVPPAAVGYPMLGCPGRAYCNCAGQGCSGANVYAAWGDMIDFAPSAGGDELWVADRWNNRVFRIANLLGQRNSGQGAFVDVVLGQPDLASTACNRATQAGGSTPHANSLCYTYDLALDAAGNLYVADNGGEAGSNNRILEFDAGQLTVAPGATSALFGVPASRVFGTGGDYDSNGLYSARDPVISPFKPGLHQNGALVTGNNPYVTQRFGVVYLNALEEQLPQLILGDFLSYPAGGMVFDAQGNLYVSDSNWSRILIYKQPLSLVATTGSLPTRTPTATRPPTPTPTPVPPCTSGLSIAKPSLKVMRNLDPAGDERIDVRGRIQLAVPAAIDPIADGFGFSVANQNGTTLFSRQVPPGAAPTRRAFGWRKGRAGTQWTFRDRLGISPGGVRLVVVRRLRASNTYGFRVYGKLSNFQVPPAELPVHVEVILGGEPQVLAGDCGTVAFGPTGTAPSCKLLNAGNTVRCR